jgi:hypothetical protein
MSSSSSGLAAAAWTCRHGLIAGERSAVGHVAREAAAGGAHLASRAALGVALREILRVLLHHVGGEAFRRLAGATPLTALAFGLAEQVLLSVRLARGRLDRVRYARRTAYNVGSTLGAIVGMTVLGGLLTVLPVVGTLLGVVVGGLLGSLGGGLLAAGLWRLAEAGSAP